MVERHRISRSRKNRDPERVLRRFHRLSARGLHQRAGRGQTSHPKKRPSWRRLAGVPLLAVSCLIWLALWILSICFPVNSVTGQGVPLVGFWGSLAITKYCMKAMHGWGWSGGPVPGPDRSPGSQTRNTRISSCSSCSKCEFSGRKIRSAGIFKT